MCIMYDLCQNGMYEKKPIRATRAAEGYIFDQSVPNIGVYASSPYYMGANMWNLLPVNIQKMNKKEQFKYELKERLKQ